MRSSSKKPKRRKCAIFPTIVSVCLWLAVANSLSLASKFSPEDVNSYAVVEEDGRRFRKVDGASWSIATLTKGMFCLIVLFDMM